MTSRKKIPVDRSNLLQARYDLPWPETPKPRSFWAVPFIIDDQISRDFKEQCDRLERDQKGVLRDQIEQELFELPSSKRRFWMAEYLFLEKLVSFHFLAFYAPSFLYLSRIMPPRQVSQRRRVVRLYLDTKSVGSGRTVRRISAWYIRSSVLFFPSDRLIGLTDRFCLLARRSADQSVRMTRYRVMLKLHLLQVMTDQELCDYFRDPHSYHQELELLTRLAKHYKIDTTEVFRMTFHKFDQLLKASKNPAPDLETSSRRKSRPLA